MTDTTDTADAPPRPIEAHRAAPPRGAARAPVRDVASGARRCARCSSCTCAPTRGDGWGECVAGRDPFYSARVRRRRGIRHRALPRPGAARPAAGMHGSRSPRRSTCRARGAIGAARGRRRVGPTLAFVAGHRMAKGALEAAVLDAELRAQGRSMGEAVRRRARVGRLRRLGRHRADPRGAARRGHRLPRGGLSAHQAEDQARLGPRARRRGARAAGARAACCRSTRTRRTRPTTSRCSRGSTRSTCCSSSSRSPRRTSRRTRASPRACDDAGVPRRVDPRRVSTAVDAIERGATSIVNIKPGRMGGYLEALRVHDVCRALDVPVWCGGMLETGVGRAANVALAALPGLRAAGRHVGVVALLRRGPHRAVRARHGRAPRAAAGSGCPGHGRHRARRARARVGDGAAPVALTR